MVDITPAIPAGRQIINGYGGGGFRISGETYQGSVIVFADRTQQWDVAGPDALTMDSFEPVAVSGGTTEILLLGTGETTVPLLPAVRVALREKGIIADVMTTGAACRTFNVLLSEDRRVTAALIAVQ